jgi:hypothetical protein
MEQFSTQAKENAEGKVAENEMPMAPSLGDFVAA